MREFTATANASGQIVINLTTVTDNATIERIELYHLRRVQYGGGP